MALSSKTKKREVEKETRREQTCKRKGIESGCKREERERERERKKHIYIYIEREIEREREREREKRRELCAV